ncbi:hypothetical protein PV783_24890 [Chitinophaga sp. CC14]|uniref:hypothetical protein n=1 Tax=Chitinophaga sp. CC14 TaxID=3029199 RepID=UPI003B7B7C8C
MTLQQTIDHLKLICGEEASRLGVAPSLIEIYLIKQLYARKKKRPLVRQYLKDCPLSKLLRQWNGPFKVLDDKSCPTFLFTDGTEVAIGSRRNSPLWYKWDDFITKTEMTLSSEAKSGIVQRLKQRLEQIETAGS